jgi:hypothetical protein
MEGPNDWKQKDEKSVLFYDTFQWKLPAGSSRVRVSFSSPNLSDDIRVKLVARAP